MVDMNRFSRAAALTQAIRALDHKLAFPPPFGGFQICLVYFTSPFSLRIALRLVIAPALTPFALSLFVKPFERCEVDVRRAWRCEAVCKVICEQLSAISTLVSELLSALERLAGAVHRGPHDIFAGVLAGHGFTVRAQGARRLDFEKLQRLVFGLGGLITALGKPSRMSSRTSKFTSVEAPSFTNRSGRSAAWT
jgi:hypothetical protein